MDEHKDYVDTGIINSTESLTDIKNSGNCFLSYSIFGEQRPCFKSVVKLQRRMSKSKSSVFV